MTLLTPIFRHEYRQLVRQPGLLISLLAFLLIGLLAIESGNQVVQKQLTQITSLQQAYQNDYATYLAKFADTLSVEGKQNAVSLGLPALINYRLPQHAIKSPEPLAALALGLIDIQPWHYAIDYHNDFKEKTERPLSNPMVLRAGNFDLAFVIIYLLPLLVLVYTYSAYAIEQETGTLSLLVIQSGSMATIILFKFLFRFVVLFLLLILINILGFSLAIKQTVPSLGSLVGWCLLSVVYLCFWVSLAWFMVALRQSATITGLLLTSCWLLLLIGLPSLTNTVVQARHPLPLNDDLAAYRRHQSEEIWNMPARVLADSFNRYYPQYASSRNPAKDTIHLSNRYINGYYELLERRMNQAMLPHQQRVAERNESLRVLSNPNPSLLIQQWFNGLAGTNLASYEHFSSQVDHVQKQWKIFLYDFELPEKALKSADFGRFPTFIPAKVGVKARTMWKSCLALLLISGLLIVAGQRLLRTVTK